MKQSVLVLINRLLGSAYRGWQDDIRGQKLSSQAMERAMSTLVNQQTGEAVRAWQGQVGHKNWQRQQMSKMLLRVLLQVVSEALAAWKALVQHKEHQSQVVRIAMMHMVNTQLAASVETWRAICIIQTVGASKLRKCVLKILLRDLSQGLASWRCWYEERLDQQDIIRTALIRLCRRAIAQVWATLQNHRHAAVHKKAALAQACKSLLLWRQAAGFRLWRQKNAERLETERVVRRGLSSMFLRHVSMAWTVWREIAAKRLSEKGAMGRTVARLFKTQLARVWASWTSAVATVHAEQRCARHYLTLVANNDIRACLVCLRTWQFIAEEMRCNKAEVMSHGIQRWLKHAQGLKHQQEVISDAVRTVVEHVLSFADWHSWPDVVSAAHEMRRLLNLWRKLYQRLESHRFEGFVKPWYGECQMLAEALTTWIDHRLAQATQLRETAIIEAALDEAREVQQVAMMFSTIAEGNFTSVLGSWQYNKKIPLSNSMSNSPEVARLVPFLAQHMGYYDSPDNNKIEMSKHAAVLESFHGKGSQADNVSDAIYSHVRSPAGGNLY